jgi:hypothetical protein
MKVLLHIGMPKCGSSALQTYLSSQAFAETCHRRYAYVALQEKGGVLAGSELLERAAASAFAYCSSHDAKLVAELTARERNAALASFKALGQKYDTLILSSEGWGPLPQLFADDCLFSDDALEVTVVAYVRPQLEWMNSAWWQWGAWADVPMMKWVNRNRSRAQWDRLLEHWSAKPWVKQVDVRLLEGDVVQDFMGYLGYPIPPQPRANQSLPETVLRLFQRNRQLRPGPHDSAIEFVLARHLKLDAGKSPWVLRPKMIGPLIEFYRQENERLVRKLPEEQRQKILGDPRWWDAEVYAQRETSKVMVGKLRADDVEPLAVAALDAIKRMDAEIRRLKCGGE